MTFQVTRGCASDFLKIIPKFKMPTRGQLKKKIVGAKTLKLKLGNYSNFQILLSHSSPYGDVQVTFSRFYWQWPPRTNFNLWVGAKINLVNFI